MRKNEKSIIVFFCLCLILGAAIRTVRTKCGGDFKYSAIPQAAAAAEDRRRVNINTADREGLTGIRGIGPVLAERIIVYRDENGKFGSLNDLLKVKGIGPKKLDAIKNNVDL